MSQVTGLGSLTRAVWVRWPRSVAERSWNLGAIVTDGYWLSAIPGVGAALPPLAAVFGLAVALARPGFETSITEALPLLLLMAALGVMSSHLGVALVAGFGVGELLLSDIPWRLELSQRVMEDHGWVADPILAALIFERGPALVHVTAVALLVVGVPVVGRGLAQSLIVHLRGRWWVDLGVAALLVALATGVVANLWASAVPQMIRPLWVFVAPWERVPTVPVEAIAPLQEQNRIIAGGVVAAVLLRAAVVWLLGLGARQQRRLEVAEAALLAPLDRTPEPSWPRDLLMAVSTGVVGVLVLGGMIDDAWVVPAVAGALAATTLVRAGRLGLPTVGFRRAVSRLPLVARFGIGLLVVQGLINATVGTQRPTGDSFQFLVWPLLAGVVVLAVLMPRPPHQPAPPSPRAGTSPSAKGLGGAALLVVVVGWALLGTVMPAAAHNCQDLSDCFRTADALVSGITGVVVVIGMLAISFSPLGTALGVVEAVTGRDAFTGEKLDPAWRFAGLLSFVRLGRAARALRGLGPTPRVAPRPTAPPPPPRARRPPPTTSAGSSTPRRTPLPLRAPDVAYLPLDRLGRATGARATIRPEHLGTGTRARPTPVGFDQLPVDNRARGHLVARQLGGDGNAVENLTPLYQRRTNSPVMRDFEHQVRAAVERGEIVDYRVVPIYRGDELVPRGITLSARGDGGFLLDVSILNLPP